MDNPYYISKMNLVERTIKLYDSLNKKNDSIKEKYHRTLSVPEMDEEYERLISQKKLKKKSRIINLKSEKLIEEYTFQYNYFKSGLNFMILISIMIVSNTFVEFKYFKINDINVSLLITGCISAGLCFALIININEKALLDSLGYVAFYLLAMIETILFFFLFLIKFYDFFLIINELYLIHNLINYQKFSSFIFMILFSVVNIIGILFCFKFILYLFLEGFDILIMKKKTLFQRQLEINKLKNKENSIEDLTNDESLNYSGFNSKDNIKLE